MTVVIRCGDDSRILRCIDSIDADVEIIVALNQNKVLQEELEKRNIRYCLTPPNNLSIISNLGVESSSYDKIIITDSDTWFEKGSISKVCNALEKTPIVNMKINFFSEKKIPFSFTISQARDFVNSLPVIYTPGIGINKSIISKIGGYLFDNDICFAVDANLTYRIKYSNIAFVNLMDAKIFHDAETLKHDLKAAYRIGKGCLVGARKLFAQGYDKSTFRIFFSLKGVKPNHWKNLIKIKGFKVFVYQLIWDAFFYLGALIQGIFLKKDIGEMLDD